jgi:hypothetical protein
MIKKIKTKLETLKYIVPIIFKTIKFKIKVVFFENKFVII